MNGGALLRRSRVTDRWTETDARLANERDADFEVLELSLVLKQMERETMLISSCSMPAATTRSCAIWCD
jgi:hypothetical protein